ncbi:MAG: peptidoglycan glycosyltransferase, partial [Bacteroidetes bacterium]|nr:peptidoglycan glycosyltransferase [Bacteroidota bacterium]
VASGTARRAYMSDFDVCGKTGTVQNPHGEDHAVFVGFAPKDNPQIAIAVIIENAGGGGRWAAPTASLMIEKYLRGEIKEKKFEENRIMSTNFIR